MTKALGSGLDRTGPAAAGGQYGGCGCGGAPVAGS